MSIFRTTEQIFKGGIHFDENWLEQHPLTRFEPTPIAWFGKNDMKLEDVDFWEVIQESGGGNGIYAAYQPYGEAYLIRNKNIYIEFFSGKNANKLAETYCKKNNISYPFEQDKLSA
jgi:hypothetical protein